MRFSPDEPPGPREPHVSQPPREPRTPRKKIWVAAVAATTALAGALTALLLLLSGNGDASPHPVSADEAQRMALARFRAYEASPSEVTIRLPAVQTGDGTITVRAVVDHHVRRAVGAYEIVDDTRTLQGLLAWDLEGLAVARPPAVTSGAEPGRTTARPPAPDIVTTAAQAVRRAGTLKREEWTRRPYSTAPLDRALRLVLSVAADRPDNAELLARSGPLWLRDERLDGHGYGVFSGPRPGPSPSASPADDSSLTYWIDTDGNLRRVTARMSPGHYATVDFVATRVRMGVPRAPWMKG
ncbi:hypothetical protein HEP84_27340 [Streptomyces sp. RLB1-33]|uniref:hypothetical protein n=1 Tax=Streptomyces mirabilis TaxID=68239 RepID=UPI00143EA07A|nr:MULTISPECIES: hypothetical protein [Streptomyces]QIY72309.1 hypothetical protein HEP84_27340 [Streptomyces sp. RLB1-33]QUW80742.1 hypothetical protein SMIR_17760 [Streptomyces mirabilis]